MENGNYTQSQKSLIELCDEINHYKPKYNTLNEFSIRLLKNPWEVRRQVAATKLGELLLSEGETLSDDKHDERNPELGLFVGESLCAGVTLCSYKNTWPAYEEVAGKFVENGEESLYQLTLRFGYANTSQTACEELAIVTSTSWHQSSPKLQANIFAAAYADTGYEGHGMRTLAANEGETLRVVEMFDQVFADELTETIERIDKRQR